LGERKIVLGSADFSTDLDVPAKFRQHNFVRPHSHGSILSVALTPIASNFALIRGTF
jgi:hypothetical protein